MSVDSARLTILDEILATKRDEVTVLHQPQTRDLLRRTALDAPPTRDFARALLTPERTVAVIGELKRRSPSKGELAPELDPGPTAKAYEAGGAAALSVLTDLPYFGGTVADLQAARSATSVPVLRKDFTIDEVQIYEARAIGADAVLLIVAALEPSELGRLHDQARGFGLDVLVEIHDARELGAALDVGACIIGVNNRNLRTLEVNMAASDELVAGIPGAIVAISESGLRTAGDLLRLRKLGYRGFLIGERFMTVADPGAALEELITACL